MPHAILKMYSGKTDAEKAKLAEEITKAIMDITNKPASSVSVLIEDIEPKDWVEKVYKPDILPNLDKLHKKPGYNPL